MVALDVQVPELDQFANARRQRRQPTPDLEPEEAFQLAEACQGLTWCPIRVGVVRELRLGCVQFCGRLRVTVITVGFGLGLLLRVSTPRPHLVSSLHLGHTPP